MLLDITLDLGDDMSEHKTKSLIRGGQLFLYQARMFSQVVGRITKWAIIIYLVIVALLLLSLMHYSDWVLLGLQSYAWILSFVGLSSVHVWTNPDNHAHFMTAGYWLSGNMQDDVDLAISHLISSGLIALGGGLIIYMLVTKLFTSLFIKSGDKHSGDSFISGTRLAKSEKETIASVNRSKRGSSDIRLLSTLPMPRYSERQGLFFHGSTGSGKTQGIMRLLDEIRASGDPAIIYDKESTLKPYFFDADLGDIELNPLSNQCANWDIWKDCQNPIEMAALATYLMPKAVQGSDPFWVDAARTIFTNVAWEMRDHPDKSIIKLLQVLLTTSLDELRQILEGTESENLVSKDIEKTAISIRAVMATYTKALRFLEGLDQDKNKTPFAIKEWVASQANDNAGHKPWLFITSRANFHAEIKPLISAWIGMAMKGIQSLEPNNHRRFWVILDEMASLNRLENFSDVVADIRKFGGCVAIGVQSISQLEFIYGQHEATAISDLLNTTIYYRSSKQRVAEWASKDLGEQVINEVKESQSYGPDPVRDGNTFARQRVTRRTVESGTILNLDDLECFVRLIGNHPITRLHTPYIEREILAQNLLVQRPINWDAIKTVSSAASTLQNHPKRDKGVIDEQESNLKNSLVAQNADLADEQEHLQAELKKSAIWSINMTWGLKLNQIPLLTTT